MRARQVGVAARPFCHAVPKNFSLSSERHTLRTAFPLRCRATPPTYMPRQNPRLTPTHSAWSLPSKKIGEVRARARPPMPPPPPRHQTSPFPSTHLARFSHLVEHHEHEVQLIQLVGEFFPEPLPAVERRDHVQYSAHRRLRSGRILALFRLRGTDRRGTRRQTTGGSGSVGASRKRGEEERCATTERQGRSFVCVKTSLGVVRWLPPLCTKIEAYMKCVHIRRPSYFVLSTYVCCSISHGATTGTTSSPAVERATTQTGGRRSRV